MAECNGNGKEYFEQIVLIYWDLGHKGKNKRVAGPKFVCFYRQIWKVQEGTGVAGLKWGLSGLSVGPPNSRAQIT